MNRRLQRTIGPKRGLAAFVLAFFALGWLADRAHIAYEVHAYCAEHQQVEHVSDDHDHDHVRGDSAAHVHVRGDSATHVHVRDDSATHVHVRDDSATHVHVRDDSATHVHVRDELAHELAHELAQDGLHGPECGPTLEALEGTPEAHAACCLLLGRADGPLALPCALTLAFGPARVESAQPAGAWGTSARGSIPLLALAPKQSPPTA